MNIGLKMVISESYIIMARLEIEEMRQGKLLEWIWAVKGSVS